MAPGISKSETASFFTKASLMGIDPKMLTELGKENIKKVEDLGEFIKTEEAQFLRPHYVLGIKLQKRLQEAVELVQCYKTVSKKLMVSGVEYDLVSRSFIDQWKGMAYRRKETPPVVTRITAELPVMRWI
eukprot:3467385-Ditylum_brightwellii.AAC.1